MDLIVNLAEVNPIAGAMVDSQFRNAFADGTHISKIAILHAVDSIGDDSPRSWIEPLIPIGERLIAPLVLANLNVSWGRFQ